MSKSKFYKVPIPEILPALYLMAGQDMDTPEITANTGAKCAFPSIPLYGTFPELSGNLMFWLLREWVRGDRCPAVSFPFRQFVRAADVTETVKSWLEEQKQRDITETEKAKQAEAGGDDEGGLVEYAPSVYEHAIQAGDMEETEELTGRALDALTLGRFSWSEGAKRIEGVQLLERARLEGGTVEARLTDEFCGALKDVPVIGVREEFLRILYPEAAAMSLEAGKLTDGLHDIAEAWGKVSFNELKHYTSFNPSKVIIHSKRQLTEEEKFIGYVKMLSRIAARMMNLIMA